MGILCVGSGEGRTEKEQEGEPNQTKLNPQGMSGTGVKPGPRRWEVSALPSGTVSYLNL